MERAPEPTTLQEAIAYFSSPVNCREYLMARRWPDGAVCPRCGSKNVLFLEKYSRWHCREKHDAPQFTLKTGTIMEDSPIGLDKWLMAMWRVVNSRNGISSCEVARAIGVTQKTAWFLDRRIRAAMQDEGHGGKIGGEVEVDETCIGGKARNMHKGRRERAMGEFGWQSAGGKVGVQGFLRRGGKVRAEIIENSRKETLIPNVQEHVDAGSTVFTDEHGAYRDELKEYEHRVINHMEQYVNGNIHTNGIENFWSCLKRTIGGTYVSVEPFHLFRYIDEQAFRSTIGNRWMMRTGSATSSARSLASA